MTDWPDTGSGAELYVVIGQAPRQLDRNIVTVGRVLRGIELLSSLPRGTGALGFYEKPEQRTPIKSIRLAADVPEAERTAIEVLRTDTPLFTRYVESRRNRREAWYLTARRPHRRLQHHHPRPRRPGFHVYVYALTSAEHLSACAPSPNLLLSAAARPQQR